MILQTRDIEILKFIDKFGYVSTEHISKFFNLTKPRTSQLLKRLVNADYIKGERILLKQPAVYILRNKAIELINATRFKSVSLQNLRHNLLVIDVYVDLKLKNPELEILSDRQLRLGRKIGQVKGDSIPDLAIETPQQGGKKNIAIEVELSKKNTKRIKTVIAKREREYIETHYYCDKSVFEFVKRESKLKSSIKVFNYFDLEEAPHIDAVAEKVGEVQANTSNEVKKLKIEINKLEADKKDLLSQIKTSDIKKDRFKSAFDSTVFKKATFGNSYSISGEDLEKLKQMLRNL